MDNHDQQRVLTDLEINEFHDRGVLVIKNVLTSEEVYEIRSNFHEYLKASMNFLA